MEYVYAIAVIIVVLAIGYFAKYFNGIDTDVVKRLLKLSEIVVKKYSDSDSLDGKYTLIKNIVVEVVEYIEVLKTHDPNEDKKKLAYDTTLDILSELGIELTYDDKLLVDFAIESAVKLLPPTGKTNPVSDDYPA